MSFIIYTLDLNTAAVHKLVFKYASLICKIYICVYAVFRRNFLKGINIVFTACHKVVVTLFEELLNRWIAAYIRHKRHCLNKHRDNVFLLLCPPSVIYSSNNAVVSVIIFCSDKSHNAGEIRGGRNLYLIAQRLELVLVNFKFIRKPALLRRVVIDIPYRQAVALAAVKKICIKLLGSVIFFASGKCRFIQGDVNAGVFLNLKFFAVISSPYICGKYHHGSAV